ncbi:MAG: Osmotically-inducible protein precursor [Pseudomonadota bacterium]|jgi:osmotically-inducible protein OsmY
MLQDFLRTFQVKLNLNRWMLSVLTASALMASLSACAPLVVGSAVMGGLVAIDRRTAGIQLEDESIELRTAQGLRQNLSEASHVNVTSYNRMVLLTGEVSSAADRERAERLAKSQENVSSVVNDLAIEPASSLTQRSKDIITTGQIKALMVDAKDLQSNAFKVIVERGIVYLMGRVTAREAQRASEIARSGTSVAWSRWSGFLTSLPTMNSNASVPNLFLHKHSQSHKAFHAIEKGALI